MFSVFVKRNPNAPQQFFECEARGLDLLSSVENGPVTPQILYVSQNLLILEHLDLLSGNEKERVEDFAKRLAHLHREPQMLFGLEEDNY